MSVWLFSLVHGGSLHYPFCMHVFFYLLWIWSTYARELSDLDFFAVVREAFILSAGRTWECKTLADE